LTAFASAPFFVRSFIISVLALLPQAARSGVFCELSRAFMSAPFSRRIFTHSA
jgi:hypothetical protein